MTDQQLIDKLLAAAVLADEELATAKSYAEDLESQIQTLNALAVDFQANHVHISHAEAERLESLDEALKEIAEISCGENQVADNDTDGMYIIQGIVRAAIGAKPTPDHKEVKCLDCGGMVPWGEPCPSCGLGL